MRGEFQINSNGGQKLLLSIIYIWKPKPLLDAITASRSQLYSLSISNDGNLRVLHIHGSRAFSGTEHAQITVICSLHILLRAEA